MTPRPPPLPEPVAPDQQSWATRARRLFFGAPRNLADRLLFHKLTLVPFLAWVGLGADPLSSSAYGPEEAFRTLGTHTYMALALAVAMAATVFVISAAYSRLIEEFPHGGGGYVVATSLLGPRTGVISGCALLVDYVLTIAVSIAAAGDALFSFLPMAWHGLKLPVEAATLAGLTILNIRGVRESVLSLTPIFVLFLLTHAVLIGGGLLMHAPELPATAASVKSGFNEGLSTLGIGGMLLLLLHAYSLGGGTYTGIEAISNGLAVLREPKVANAKRTMAYMAVSLALTASGLMLCYLLWHVMPEPGKTMNAVLAESFASETFLGKPFVILTLLTEGALLIVAAQAGFLDGPRVLANMAVDSWVPRRFAALSERFTTRNGILLMGAAGLSALLYTGGSVHQIVVMYSINVFLTFSLSLFGMSWSRRPGGAARPGGRRHFALFTSGFLLCATILLVIVVEKFGEGGWMTLLVTGGLVVLCFLIRGRYETVRRKFAKLSRELEEIPEVAVGAAKPVDPAQPTAAVLVGAYDGLGLHTTFNIFRTFPGHFKNLVFISVGVIDSGVFKGEQAIESLRKETDETLRRYVELAQRLGIPATSRQTVGTDAVEECEKLCLAVAKEFPRVTFFSGQIIFQRERWYHRFLHNETAFSIQKRLQWAGLTMVILPARVR